MTDNHESNFDLYVHKLLTDSGINAEYQHTSITELQNALSTASKSQTGERGMPDFIASVGEFLLIIEDKADRDKLCLRDNDGKISLDVKATKDYALNGALWYARKILEGSTYTKIFAFGNAGNPKHHTMKPIFVDAEKIVELAEIETFGNFSPDNIDAYYHSAVCKETPPAEIQQAELRDKAKTLHEHLRNYGKLGETEKPLVVSAILLALMEQPLRFSLDSLTGDKVDGNTDGDIIFMHMVNSLKRAKVSPAVKLQKVIDQFTLIKNRPVLNTLREEWKNEKNPYGKTPLKFFAEYINSNIYRAIRLGNSPEDYLGIFYSEFVRYSGGDGATLGIVLTPSHITELFCDLVNLKAGDVIFDPCCGTGGFLVAGMHRLLSLAENDSDRKRVKETQIFGIEIRDDMFAVATTNMILRGDGQSNLICEDFLMKNPDDIQLQQITAGFMNPPYSQAKSKETQNLSELNFISRLLDCITKSGRAAVIVPVSVMIGKTKEDRQLKSDILKRHTLEGVISLNKDTFYGVGTVPCIAVFTAGEPHPKEKRVKFINFQNDGYEVKMHKGLVKTDSADDRRQYLLDCWRGKISDAPSDFMVETVIDSGDEWLHSFYYYNDEIPTEKDFADSLADYLTFEFNMIVHGRGYLFGVKENDT